MKRKQQDSKQSNKSQNQNYYAPFNLKEQNFMTNQSMNEQLRAILEESEHHKLTKELEQQKRILVQQQVKNLKQEIQELRGQNDQLKRDLIKIGKKYVKIKQKRQCERCKQQEDLSERLQKQRELYIEDRHILQSQIKELKSQMQSSQSTKENQKLQLNYESLKKENGHHIRHKEQLQKIINFLNQKLSIYEMENIRIMKNIQLLEEKIKNQEIQSMIEKGKRKEICFECKSSKTGYHPEIYENCSNLKNKNTSFSHQKRRKTGSIKNINNKIEGEIYNTKNKYFEELQRYENNY